MPIHIRFREPADDAEWLRMRCAPWPDVDAETLRRDMPVWLARPDAAVLVAERPGGGGLAGIVARTVDGAGKA